MKLPTRLLKILLVLPTILFNKGNAHYIVVDNNFFIGRDYFYMGYLDEKTFAWLDQGFIIRTERVTRILLLCISLPVKRKSKKLFCITMI